MLLHANGNPFSAWLREDTLTKPARPGLLTAFCWYVVISNSLGILQVLARGPTDTIPVWSLPFGLAVVLGAGAMLRGHAWGRVLLLGAIYLFTPISVIYGLFWFMPMGPDSFRLRLYFVMPFGMLCGAGACVLLTVLLYRPSVRTYFTVAADDPTKPLP